MRPTALIADMAGTTVSDGGIVLAAFGDALDALGIPEGHDERLSSITYVVDTMGRSKIEVFTELFGSHRAHDANVTAGTRPLERGPAAANLVDVRTIVLALEQRRDNVVMAQNARPDQRRVFVRLVAEVE